MESQWNDKDSKNYRYINNHKSLSDSDSCILYFLEQNKIITSSTKILSIGAGPAQLETFLAKQKNSKITIIEPDQTFFSELENSGYFSKDSRCTTFQDFKSRSNFKLILSVNSWYYINEDEKALAKALRLLEPNGSIVIVMVSERSIGYAFESHWRDKKFLNPTIEQILTWLRSIDIDFHFEYKDFPFPIRECFNNKDELTEKTKKWISFTIGREFKELSSEEQNETIELLKSLVDPDGNLHYTLGLLHITKE